MIFLLRNISIYSLRRGPGANVQDASGYSALHHAALNGHRYVSFDPFQDTVIILYYQNLYMMAFVNF